MAGKVACTCTVYSCGKQSGGQCLLPPALFKKHQIDQLSADLREMALGEQAAEKTRLQEVQRLKEMERMETVASERIARQAEKARLRESGIEARAAEALKDVKRMEKEQEELLTQSQWTPDSLPAVRSTPRFLVDHHRIKVGVLGSLLDLLDIYDAELELSKSPPAGLALDLLEAGVLKLDNLSIRSQNLKRDISLVCLGKTFPGAMDLRSQASEGIKTQTEKISEAKGAWNSAIQKEMERRTNANAPTYNTAHLYKSILLEALAPIQVILYMIVVCSTVLSFSRRGCSWLFRMSHAAIVEAFRMSPVPATSDMGRADDSFPRDLQTAIKQFNIDSKATTFAVCSNCNHLHPPISTDPLPVYPERCNHRRYNRGPKCTALLVRPTRSNNITRFVPIKPFVSFDFKDWMAKLLARPGNEEAMDGKWATLKPPVKDTSAMTPDEKMDYAADIGTETSLDIFDGSVVRGFKGPDGRHFSIPSKDGEGRYLFSLAFDAFNPLSNKQAGKKLSVGAFALICLNLPVEERYKPENMFLAGVIPGPKEPPLDEINSYWTPLVDCFLEFWHTGVYFDRTFQHARGRLVRCAIVALICDILAARKIGGMASCMHEWFCTHCLCTRAVRRSAPGRNRRAKNKKNKKKKDAEDHFDESQLEAEMEMARNERGDGDDGADSINSASTEAGLGNRVGYNNFNTDSWMARTIKGVRKWAERYRTAPTQAEAQAHFDKSGVRWTEFLRLPYFDLPKMLVIDSMHNLFLGLLKEHFRNILGFRPTPSTPKPIPIDVLEIDISPTELNPLPTKTTELDSLKKVLALLRQPMSAALKDPVERLKIPLGYKFAKLHVASALYIAKGLNLENLEKQRNPKRPNVPVYLTRKELVTKILDWRVGRPEQEPPSPEPLVEDAFPEVEHITQVEKEALWDDLAAMVKPSWVTSVPPHFGGESSDGKLKADQWRMLATLYMPVTLIRLWAASGVGTERRALLDLTMDLVSAIILASSRTTSLSHSQQCEDYLLAYRTKLSKLFPDYKCHPNHHFAMHIPAFLLLFGPVHGWWTFPLERLIGKLQRVPTNYKPGEYEKTIGQKFHRSANLTLMSTAPSFPAPLRKLVDLFEKLIRPQTRNVFLDDELATLPSPKHQAKAHSLPQEIITAFASIPQQCPHTAVTPNFITYKGVRYTVNSMHQGNSSIFVDDDEGKPIPFVIEAIVQDELAAYLAVRRVKPVDVDDPFQEYPVLGAKIWSRCDDLEANWEIILPSQVVGHFASCATQVKGRSGEMVDAAVIVPLRKSVVLDYGEQVAEEAEVNGEMDF